MLELITLGTAEVRGADGASIPVEPKRLGLLVYLAVAHVGNAISRNTLLAMFWPELGEQEARSALRQALHHLAARLGPDVLVGRGTNEVGVDLRRLRCDAFEFDVALDANEIARAMRLLRGEFLEGFLYGQASRTFLDWVDEERRRLRERAFDAALVLIDEEARRGNVTGQVHWLKRALDLEPFREDLLERIVDLYEREGNRAPAAQTIRAFARTLRTRYGGALSPVLRERLRTLQGELLTTAPAEDPHRRMHALHREVSAEMERTADLMRQLQALTRPRRSDD